MARLWPSRSLDFSFRPPSFMAWRRRSSEYLRMWLRHLKHHNEFASMDGDDYQPFILEFYFFQGAPLTDRSLRHFQWGKVVASPGVGQTCQFEHGCQVHQQLERGGVRAAYCLIEVWDNQSAVLQWTTIRASLQFEKRLIFSTNLRKLSIINWSFSKRSEALATKQTVDEIG